MARNKNDSGDWHLDSADDPMGSIKSRVDTQLGVTSPEVIAAMKKEEAFLATITGRPDTKRFTDRRPIPGRDRLIP